jgi:hypothetical protein
VKRDDAVPIGTRDKDAVAAPEFTLLRGALLVPNGARHVAVVDDRAESAVETVDFLVSPPDE